MAVSAMVPLLWGIATQHISTAVWATLSAECLCWVELKGSYTWRIRTLTAGTILIIFFSFLGSVTGNNILLSIICMLGVGFITGVLKNVGDRANGLAICVYLLFIFCNAYPTQTFHELIERVVPIGIGVGWTIFVSMGMSLFMPAEKPYRRYIALIWKSIASLIETIGQGWDGTTQRINIRGVYLKEKEVRAAINNSYQFFASMAHQVSEKDKQQFQLAQLRKATGLVASHVIAISDEMENIQMKFTDNTLRVKISSLLSAMQNAAEQMSSYILILNPEEKVLTGAQVNRVKKLILFINNYPALPSECFQAIKRITHLAERSVKLIESAMGRIEQLGTDAPVFRTYPLVKTLFILHPKYWIANFRLLLNFNTFTAKYAIRSAIAASLALFLYKWFHISHGYWLPFSVMIVLQPYFRATLKKAIDRVVGTLLGGFTGSIFIHAYTSIYLKELILFITFILMVYFLRKKYSIAAFAITLNLVLLFNIESALDTQLIITRALCTIGGAFLAVVSGFVLLPTSDKKWLPKYLHAAILSNYKYFTDTFFTNQKITNWTRPKRVAETNNSNVFDSFNRYTEENKDAEKLKLYFDIITHSVRITRYINNIHLEEDHKNIQLQVKASPTQQQKVNETLLSFNHILEISDTMYPAEKANIIIPANDFLSPFYLTENQMLYLEKLSIELDTMQIDIKKLGAQAF